MTANPESNWAPTPRWAQVPHGISFCGDATSVATDSRDNVYVFNRGSEPVVIFDRHGSFVGSWGADEFVMPHGISIDDDDNLLLVDSGGHFVQRRRPDGALLLTIGVSGSSSKAYSGEPFNQPTDAVVDPSTGDIFVADGYGNAVIHRFDATGRHISSWGSSGTGPGQFCCPHNLTILDDGRLVVCDRENYRLQFFTTEGKFLDQWHVFHPLSVRQSPVGDRELFVGEMGPPGYYYGVPRVGSRIGVWSQSGELAEHIGAPTPGLGSDQFVAPHGLAVDSAGTLYVAEVNQSYLVRLLGRDLGPGEVVSLRRWVRTIRTLPADDESPATTSVDTDVT